MREEGKRVAKDIFVRRVCLMSVRVKREVLDFGAVKCE